MDNRKQRLIFVEKEAAKGNYERALEVHKESVLLKVRETKKEPVVKN